MLLGSLCLNFFKIFTTEKPWKSSWSVDFVFFKPTSHVRHLHWWIISRTFMLFYCNLLYTLGNFVHITLLYSDCFEFLTILFIANDVFNFLVVHLCLHFSMFPFEFSFIRFFQICRISTQLRTFGIIWNGSWGNL